MIKITSEKQFKDTISSDNQITIIYCWRGGCGSCGGFTPTVSEFAEKQIGVPHKIPVAYYQIETSDNFIRPFLGEKNLPVTGVPALVIYYDGRVVGHHVGAVETPVIEEFINRTIAEIIQQHPALTPPILNVTLNAQ